LLVKRSLSVVLPVCNAERTLSDNLQAIFEILSDLTERFEVLVVDNGSTDQTMEIAHELSVQYPQLRVARPSAPLDEHSGLDQATGDVVLLHGAQLPFSPNDARRTWEMCQHDIQEEPWTSGSHRIDTPQKSDRGIRSGVCVPRPLALLDQQGPRLGSLTILRHPVAE
jgi:glycosyltransferase involved in cell wall biosynthesis